ncbi:hypothetical protein T01_14778 [Trichinella spiralis]|uniref:Uncharacterized protein n=1 Tax=Trichinella spiralis TaxID=6334 RepID=A0A0V1B8E8_TRISP|nr:hypothetical protein T01_14778 [Trichinella spiralis]
MDIAVYQMNAVLRRTSEKLTTKPKICKVINSYEAIDGHGEHDLDNSDIRKNVHRRMHCKELLDNIMHGMFPNVSKHNKLRDSQPVGNFQISEGNSVFRLADSEWMTSAFYWTLLSIEMKNSTTKIIDSQIKYKRHLIHKSDVQYHIRS